MRESLCRVRGCSGCIDCVQHSCAPAGASNASNTANMLMTAMQILDFECVDSKSSQVESSLYHGGRCET